MIHPSIIRRLELIAEAHESVAASLNHVVRIADKIEKHQADLVATHREIIAKLEAVIAAIIKGYGPGPTAGADPTTVSRIGGAKHSARQ